MPEPEPVSSLPSQVTLHTGVVVLAAVAAGALVWIPLLVLVPQPSPRPERLALLLVVLGNQPGCLLVGLAVLRGQPALPRRSNVWVALGTGFLAFLLAGVLGVAYDELLSRLLDIAPTIGPWGATLSVSPLGAGLIVASGIVVGPSADELFFRAALFRPLTKATNPWLGAVVSSVLFALSRLDAVNFPAYVGLGLLLCFLYHRTGSLLASWMAHTLLNATMLLLLFHGYQ